MKKSSRRVFEELLNTAMFRTTLAANPDDMAYERCLRRNESIPEQLRPGYLLTRLSKEDREALAGLTSDIVASYGQRK